MLCALRLLLQLSFGADESYNLTVPTTGDPLYAQIQVSKKFSV
jgi:hexosaminidase